MALAILLLFLFGLVLLKLRPGFGVLSLGVALLLFTTTPAGAELPGWFGRTLDKAGSAADSVVNTAPGAGRTATTTAPRATRTAPSTGDNGAQG